jgi:uncharacterized protein
MKNMDEKIKEMLKRKIWVVVGVTIDTEKFGYKIYQKLKKHGYKVYGVNPKYDEINGEKMYQTIKELPEKPDCVSMVVNPKVSSIILEEIKELGIPFVWFQPGAYNDDIIDQCGVYDLDVVYGHCILVTLGD